MSSVFVHGTGAVSPAGWSTSALRHALAANQPLPVKEFTRAGWDKPMSLRQVPPAQPRPAYLNHPRLRRSSPVAQFAVAAGMEAVAGDAVDISAGKLRLGIVFAVMSGCVNYSRRFYDETLRDPATASPLVFPETVYNAPASHLASVLGTNAISYTLVGDPGTFVQGLALAADWLLEDRVDGCVVVGAEENDWLTSQAFRLFHKHIVLSDGAGAVYLRREPGITSIRLSAVTDSHLYLLGQNHHCAAQKMQAELPLCPNALLCDGTQSIPSLDEAELHAWKHWTGARLSPKTILGEGMAAGSAWQCVAAIDALAQQHATTANVSVVGVNQQAIGAQFSR